MKIISDDLVNLTKQFTRIGEFASRKRDIKPLILNEIGGKYPLVNINVIDESVTRLTITNTKSNPVIEDIINDINKVLLKQYD